MAVRSWVADLTTKLSPASVHKAHQVLSKVLRSAVAAGLISKNPAENVPLPRQERTEMRMLTPVEVQALADAMDPRYRALVITAAYTGLRIGELMALRRSNVDLLRRRITVTETLVEVKGELIFNPPKTARGFRTVPMPNVVVRELERHLVSYGEGSPTSLVFAAPEGGPIRLSLWRRRFFHPSLKRTEIGHLTIHELRHTAVSLWIAAGASPVEVARWAGHSRTQSVFDVYGHLMPGTEDQVTDALDNMAESALKNIDPTTQVRRLNHPLPAPSDPPDAASSDS
jgi:integrase